MDGTQGLSSQAISKGKDSPIVEKWLSKNYDNGLVLTDDYRRTIGPVESGIPMNAFIGSGNKPYWAESLDNPTKYAKWVVVQKADTDAVWIGMKNKNILLKPCFSYRIFGEKDFLDKRQKNKKKL